MITVQDLTVRYDDRTILQNINFDVKRGEIFVILGGSGCGKSTLLRHLVGLRDPQGGKIVLQGQQLNTEDIAARQKVLDAIGVMFQGGALFGSMTLLENVCLPLEERTNLPIKLAQEIARYKLCLVGLQDFLDFLPAEISGGMQKRAAIARAMALDPEILFLDEPSAGLDPVTSANLDALILKLSRELGVTFVVVSHELPSIFTIADRVIMLQDGGIIAEGKPKDLHDHSDNRFVKQFFHRQSEAEGEHAS